MSLNKDAKRLRDNYGVAYSTALRLIREHGLDAAIELCTKVRGCEDDTPSAEGGGDPLTPEKIAELRAQADSGRLSHPADVLSLLDALDEREREIARLNDALAESDRELEEKGR